MTRTADDSYAAITAKIIDALDRGTAPWTRPWKAGSRPTSMSTGRPYHGINVLLLGISAMEAGYASPFWGTYYQVRELGGQVRKGEHGTLVVLFKTFTKTETVDGERVTRTIPVLRTYSVFNADQADGLPGKYHGLAGDGPEELAEPQQVLDAYLADGGPALIYADQDRAFYQPGADTITVPARSQFADAAAMWSTIFHEAGHSTGHTSRLNREGIAQFDHFGSERYSKEELVAELTAAFLTAATGVQTETELEQSAAYIAGWRKALTSDSRLIVRAASAAQKASDLVLGVTETQDSAEHELAVAA